MSKRNEQAGEIARLISPPCFSTEIVIDRNRARQLLTPQIEWIVSESESGLTVNDTDTGASHRLLRRRVSLAGSERALFVPSSINISGSIDLSQERRVTWFGDVTAASPELVLDSLRGAFHYREEDASLGIQGLRTPQLGALHAVLGYWTTHSTQPVTVVMPTGTGKTETMLALFACARIRRLLIVVPSDALRDQIAAKFESFGVLQRFGVVSYEARRPVVGRIRHSFSSTSTAREFARACNIIVATPAALFAAAPDVRAALIEECTHLFIDEAHHVAAETWRAIRDSFDTRPVVQFTATPFREDGRHLGGHLLYAFPLKEAQRQGYFSRINYTSVVDFDDPERAIAARAVGQLRADLAEGLDHILMARVKRIGRAQEVLALYEEIASEMRPVVVHNKAKKSDRSAALASLHARTSRIIVCVDMLGEGFDLPSLKVAAIHDPHKSLGVTLQFVGRFARVTDATIGDATVVVGRPELEYDDTLRKLYAEDADWNLLVRDISETKVGSQQEVSDFEASFTAQPEEISIRTLLPRMSTVVYRTGVDWRPEGILEVFSEEDLLTSPVAVNPRDCVAWFVTEEREEVRWGDVKTVEEISHDLYVVYWDSSRRLLYINSSNTDSLHEDLAKAVCGETAERIRGEEAFRAMTGVKRLVPTNVGVLDIRNRARRFSMHVGADVSEGFPVAEAQTKTKTNIFAYGFEEGKRVSVGASVKGRVWSYRIAGSLKEWVDWCNHVGGKLIDSSLSVDQIMANFIRPKVLDKRPELVPLALEWPWEIFLSTSEEVRLRRGEEDWPLVDVELTLRSFDATGPIKFSVVAPGGQCEYTLNLAEGAMTFVAEGEEAYVVTRREGIPLSQFFAKKGLTVLFEQDATVVPPGMFLQLDRTLPPYDSSRLRAISWEGIDLRKESQGKDRAADSVQARAVEHLQTLGKWDLVIDDDGPGEIADIVAMQLDEDELLVHLVHCKYSSANTPGARIADLYEVCGQAQKSSRWKRNPAMMFRHLIRREKKRSASGRGSGIIVGTGNKLYELEDRARFAKSRFLVSIAQPGLSQAAVSPQILELLASTEVYLHETALADLVVYCSE